MADWYDNQKSNMEARKNASKEAEWAFLQVREQHKSEPWAKIIDCCEMG